MTYQTTTRQGFCKTFSSALRAKALTLRCTSKHQTRPRRSRPICRHRSCISRPFFRMQTKTIAGADNGSRRPGNGISDARACNKKLRRGNFPFFPLLPSSLPLLFPSSPRLFSCFTFFSCRSCLNNPLKEGGGGVHPVRMNKYPGTKPINCTQIYLSAKLIEADDFLTRPMGGAARALPSIFLLLPSSPSFPSPSPLLPLVFHPPPFLSSSLLLCFFFYPYVSYSPPFLLASPSSHVSFSPHLLFLGYHAAAEESDKSGISVKVMLPFFLRGSTRRGSCAVGIAPGGGRRGGGGRERTRKGETETRALLQGGCES